MTDKKAEYATLVVEDKYLNPHGLSMSLRYEGFEVLQAQDGKVGLQKALDQAPKYHRADDDAAAQRLRGDGGAARTREQDASGGCSARGQERDKVIGLDLTQRLSGEAVGYRNCSRAFAACSGGAIATSRSGCPSTTHPHQSALEDRDAGVAISWTARVGATPTRRFVGNPRPHLSRDELLSAAWGYGYEGTARTVDNFVSQLR